MLSVCLHLHVNHHSLQLFSMINMLLVFLSIIFVSSTSACPQHSTNVHRRGSGSQDWNYESTYNWGSLNTSYATCQTGTQQSPIPLSLTQGLSSRHVPTFSDTYTLVAGSLYNWGDIFLLYIFRLSVLSTLLIIE